MDILVILALAVILGAFAYFLKRSSKEELFKKTVKEKIEEALAESDLEGFKEKVEAVKPFVEKSLLDREEKNKFNEILLSARALTDKAEMENVKKDLLDFKWRVERK